MSPRLIHFLTYMGAAAIFTVVVAAYTACEPQSSSQTPPKPKYCQWLSDYLAVCKLPGATCYLWSNGGVGSYEHGAMSCIPAPDAQK